MFNKPWAVPKTWEWTSFESIAEINPKLPYELGDDIDVSFIPMSSVEEETGYVDLSQIKKYGEVKKGYTKFIDGDIIFAKITPCMENGKVAVLSGLKNGVGFGSTEFHVIRLEDDWLSKRFYFHYMLQKWFRNLAAQNFTGTVGQRRVPTDYMKSSQVPVPPFNEQVRIVGRVEELFSQLDAGVRSLQATQTRLEQYRQATLQQAYTGKLTQKWRNKNSNNLSYPYKSLDKLLETRKKLWDQAYKEKVSKKGNYRLPYSIKSIPDVQIPKEWDWVSLDTFTFYTIDYRGKTPPTTEKGIPIISAANVDTGQIVITKPRFVSIETYRKWITRGLPKPGDLILTTEAPVGESALFPDNETYLLTRRVLACQTFHILNDYLLHYFYTRMARRYIDQHSSGTTVPRILKPNLLSIPIPTPSLEEQKIIVEYINLLHTKSRYIDILINKSFKIIDYLKTSILKKAFEGKLIQQDPDDEPANILLERIKAKGKNQTRLM